MKSQIALLTIFTLLNSNAINLHAIESQLAQLSSSADSITKALDMDPKDMRSVLEDNKVVIFVKNDCIYCTQVEDLFESMGIDTYVVNMETVSDNAGVKKLLDKKSGNSIVPKVFIDKKYVGMLSQIKEMQKSGELEELLQDSPGDMMEKKVREKGEEAPEMETVAEEAPEGFTEDIEEPTEIETISPDGTIT